MEFLDYLGAGIDIEIVVAALPETAKGSFLGRKSQGELSLRCALFAAQAAREALFEDLNDCRRSNRSRFADEQVDVFGHDDVADQSETVAGAHFFEDLHGKVSGADGVEERPSLVTAESDEMQIAATGDALEVLGHRRKEGPTLCTERNAKGRPPRRVRCITW